MNFASRAGWTPNSHKLRVISEDDRLKAGEIARLYGLSASRIRQLTGTRDNPLDTFGPPLKIEGERGFTWQARRVYQYAMEHDIAIKNMPALFPNEKGKPARYALDNYKTGVYSYTEKNNKVLRDVWIFVFVERVAYDSHPYTIYLAVPLGTDTVFMDDVTLHDLCQREGWFGRIDEDYSIFAVLPVLNEQWSYMYVRVGDGQGNTVNASVYKDLLQCIGWKKFPAWGEGLATTSLLAQWRPGVPSVVRIPTAIADRWAFFAYALERSRSSDKHQASWLELARAVWNVGIKNWAEDVQREDLSENEFFEWGVQIELPEQPEVEGTERSGVSYYAALEELVTSVETPTDISATAINYMGDHSYSHPATVLWNETPNEWASKLQKIGEQVPANSDIYRTGRGLHLVRFFQKNFPQYLAQDLRILPQGMALVCAAGMTYISSLGSREDAKTFEEELASTWPKNAHKVLVHRSSLSSRLVVWVMNIEGEVTPIATSAPWLPEPAHMLARAVGEVRHYSEHLSPSADIHQLLGQLKPGKSYEFSAHDFVALFK